MSAGVSPARSIATRAAASAMSVTVSSAAAKRRLTMPERSRIHSSEESMVWQISSLVTTRVGPVAADRQDPGVLRAGRGEHGVRCGVRVGVGSGPASARAGRTRARSISGCLRWLRRVGGHATGRVRGHQGAGGVQVVGCLDRDHLDPGQGPLGEVGQGAGRGEFEQAGDAEVAQRRQAQVPADRVAHLVDQPRRASAPSCDDGRRRRWTAAAPTGVLRGDRPRRSAESTSTAGAMWWVWKAPATCSGITRARAGGSAASACSCSSVPAATTCPAPFMFAGGEPVPVEARRPPRRGRRRARRSSRSGVTALAAAIARPRSRTSSSGLLGGQHPGHGGGGELTDRVPGDGAHRRAARAAGRRPAPRRRPGCWPRSAAGRRRCPGWCRRRRRCHGRSGRSRRPSEKPRQAVRDTGQIQPRAAGSRESASPDPGRRRRALD